MLSLTPVGFHPLALDCEDEDHRDRELPGRPSVVQQTHWIHDRSIEVEAYPAPRAAAVALEAEAALAAMSGSLHPLDSIPQLRSNPGARAKLYLDFDGHLEPTVTTPVYDRDGDLSTFGDAELESIYIIWSRVAEDYAPFNIDVTTIEPPELASGVPESVANGIAVRIVIGGDGSWTGGVHGGIAPVGGFTNSAANTAYVFEDNLSDFWTHWIGDVASHEAGHTFGLSHQSSYDQNGVRTDAYNPGSGDWAPLMGYTYQQITTWYNGTSSSSTTFQDDMAVLAGPVNGFGYRADDHGNTIADASPLGFDGLAYSGAGIIGTNSDVDVWSFTVSTQDTFRLAVDPAAFAPNLDAVLELRDAAGALIAGASPAFSQAAEFVVSLSPASYFLSVTKTAVYGWLGQYTVNISTPPAGITVSASKPIVTPEGGPATTFSLVLETQPTADVTIPLTSSDEGLGAVSATSLVFTSANWNTPQVVSVTGVADNVRDGDVPYSIILGAAASADPKYAGMDPADVAAVNLDNSSAGFVYWADNTNDAIRRSTLHGTNAETIVDLKALFGGASSYEPRGLDVDLEGSKVYWTDAGVGVIRRANLDGSNVETIASGFTGNGLRGIAIDSVAGKMYWTDFAAQKIQRANLDGSAVQDLVTGSLSGVREIALDLAAGKMYWADINGFNVRRANLDGTDIQVLWSGTDADRPTGIELDTSAGKMYWSDQLSDRIYRANLDGSSAEELIDMRALFPAATVASLAIDVAAGKLYFSDIANQSVFRANLDGSDMVAISSDAGAPQGIAILAPGITVKPHTGLSTNESGGAATFQVVLTTPPQANVTIPINSSNLLEGAVSAASVTFTPGNWNVPQTITVTGVDDAALDGSKAYSVMLGAASSSDLDYSGLDPRDVSVTNFDNDLPQTKFYVVNDASQNRTYEYDPSGGLVESYSLNSGNAAPRGAASTVAGDKTWVIDANRKVYVYNASGALLGSWSAGSLANNATPEGIATNGTDVWIVDAKSDKVYRYAGAASRLSGSQTAASSFSLNSGNSNPKDIVTNGQHLWVVNDATTDKVFKYTVSGALQGSWTIDSANRSPTGLTIDPASPQHIWIVDSGTDRVYRYDSAIGRTSGSQSAAASFALAAGNTNPQGIADPPAPVAATLAGVTSPTRVQAADRTSRRSDFDAHEAALVAALNESISSRSDAHRTANAAARNGAAREKVSGSFHRNASAFITVHDDYAKDLLFAGVNQDWFLGDGLLNDDDADTKETIGNLRTHKFAFDLAIAADDRSVRTQTSTSTR